MKIGERQSQPCFNGVRIRKQQELAERLPSDIFDDFTQQTTALTKLDGDFVLTFNPCRNASMWLTCARGETPFLHRIHKDKIFISDIAKSGAEALLELETQNSAPILHSASRNSKISRQMGQKSRLERLLKKSGEAIVIQGKEDIYAHLPMSEMRELGKQIRTFAKQNTDKSYTAIGFNPKRQKPFSVVSYNYFFMTTAMEQNLQVGEVARAAKVSTEKAVREGALLPLYRVQTLGAQEISARYARLAEIEATCK